MAKQDVLEAIDATIIPNGVKGITADTLNSVLTMIVENAGEGGGSGDGALRVIVPEMSIIGMYFIEEGMITEEMVDEKLAEMEGGAAGNEPFIRMMRAYKEVFAHNAEVFAAIVEKAKKGEGCMVLLDQSPLLKVYCDIMLDMEPEIAEMVDAYAMSCSQVANVNLLYADIKPEYESSYGEDEMSLILAPVHANPDITMCPIYPSNMVVGLMPDGSLLFEVIEEEQPSSGSGVVFYTTLSGEITEEQKEKNVASFSKYAAGIPVSVIVNAEGHEATYYPFVASYIENDGGASGLSFLACNFPIKKPDGNFAAMLFYEDGSVVMQME
jgi:hypothetical protein